MEFETFCVDRLVAMMEKFARPFLTRINQNNFSVFADNDEDDFETLCGFDVMHQVLWLHHTETLQDALRAKRGNGSGNVLAPETQFQRPTSLSPRKVGDVVLVPETMEPMTTDFRMGANRRFDDAGGEKAANMSPTFNVSSSTLLDEESPSIINNKRCQTVEINDEDDFRDFTAPQNPPPAKKALKAPPRKPTLKTTNRFGCEVTETTASQRERNANLKQSNIKSMLKNKTRKRQEDEEDDLKRALELSKREHDAFKYANAPVRGKEARKLLLGLDCEECRAFYGNNSNLDEATVAQLIQKCSKHRAKFASTTKSPVKIWNMDDMLNDEDVNKTQYDPKRTFKK